MSINVPNFLSAIMPKRKSGSTSNGGKGKASKRQKGQTAKEVTSPTNPDLAPVPPNQAANGVAQPATGEPVILSQNQIVTGQDAFPTGGQVMVSSQDMQGKALGTQPSASGGGSFRVQCSQDQNILTDISSQTGTALFLPQPGGSEKGLTVVVPVSGLLGIQSGGTFGHQLSSVGDPVGANVPLATKEKIWKGEFVPLASMIVDKQTTLAVPSWSFQQVGSNLVAQQAQPPKKEIRDIGTWTNAFIIFMGIYIQKHANRAQELLKYMETIRSYAQGLSNTAWIGYDREFRARQERNPSRSWAAIDMEAYARMLMGSSSSSSQSGLMSSKQFWGRQTLSQRRSSNICYAFNRGECGFGASCHFRHVCQSCGKPGHTGRTCYGVQTVRTNDTQATHKTCTKCGRQGHTAAFCRMGRLQSQNQQRLPVPRPIFSPTTNFSRPNAR